MGVIGILFDNNIKNMIHIYDYIFYKNCNIYCP